MGEETKTHPKCMTEITEKDTIVSRQLKQLVEMGINEIVMTTGYFDDILKDYINSLCLPIKITYVKNPLYAQTNYIYSIYCARDLLDDDIVMMHGDLVFSDDVLLDVVHTNDSCMTVSSTLPLPEKDFKAVVKDDMIEKVGTEFFDSAYAAQPLYKLNKNDWIIWLNNIISFCENENTSCYAENAFNDVSDQCCIKPLDIQNELCSEIDNKEDLQKIREILINKGEKNGKR